MIKRLFKKHDFGEEILSKIVISFRVFISFGPPKMGSTLIRLADQLTLKKNANIEITALHITPSSEIKPQDALLYEKEGFQPIRSTAQLLNIKLKTIYKNTEEVENEIKNTAMADNYDLILVGAAKPLFNDKATGGKLHQLIEESTINVAVLVDRGFVLAENIFVLINSENDKFLLQYADRFVGSNSARITILKTCHQKLSFLDPVSEDYSVSESFKEVIEQRIPDKHLLSHFNLVLVSLEYWDLIWQANWIRDSPSILVIKHLNDLKSEKEALQIERVSS
jgi:hypothetical protein